MIFCETDLWNNHYLEKIIHERKVGKVREKIGTEKTRRRGTRDMEEGDRITGKPSTSVLVSVPPAPTPNITVLFPGHGKVPTGAESQVCENHPLMGKGTSGVSGPSAVPWHLWVMPDCLPPGAKNERRRLLLWTERVGIWLSVGRGVLYGKVSGQTAAKWVGWEVGLDTPTLS